MIRGLLPPRKKCHRPRRWVVEHTLAWLAKCRAPDPLGQEGLQLPRTPQARLHANLVPPLLSPGTIVGPTVIWAGCSSGRNAFDDVERGVPMGTTLLSLNLASA